MLAKRQVRAEGDAAYRVVDRRQECPLYPLVRRYTRDNVKIFNLRDSRALHEL